MESSQDKSAMLEEGTACAIGGQVKRRGAILVAIPCAFHIHRGGVVAKKTKHTHTHTHSSIAYSKTEQE